MYGTCTFTPLKREISFFVQVYTKYSFKEPPSAANDTVAGDVIRELTYRSGTNTLGIIFFCLTFGTVLGSFGKKAEIVIDFFSVIDEVIMKMVYGIMW